jgi:hypothetical protein
VGGGDPSEPITSANVRERIPAGETVEQVAESFRRRGFTTGPTGPLSVSITAVPAVFARNFATTAEHLEQLLHDGVPAAGFAFDIGGLEPPSR